MLRHILETGYVDPELLDNLTGDQKEILFFKIREEQVRKWKLREKELEEKSKLNPIKHSPRKIVFLEGKNGEPLVTVIGDDDKAIEDEHEKEIQLIRREAEELAKHEVTSVAVEKFMGKPNPPARTESVIDGLQESPEPTRKATTSKGLWEKAVQNRAVLIQKMTKEERIEYQQRRAEEIFQRLHHVKQLAKKRAAEIANDVEERWKKSESEAKAFDQQKRRSFTRAKQVFTKGVDVDKKILGTISPQKQAEIQQKILHRGKENETKFARRKVIMCKRSSRVQPDTQPKSIEHAISWFKDYEAPKAVGKELDGSISLWFHGAIDRESAEKALEKQTEGTFLVRLSKRIWGYTVSVKIDHKIKHYVVDASKGQYTFMGPGQPMFKTMSLLLAHYRVNPITWSGKELLLVPCEQVVSLLDVQQLYITADEEDEEEESSML